MPEPTSTTTSIGLLGLFVTLLGPLLGPWAFILFGATLGAATALSARDTSTAWQGAKFVMRVVCTSLFFTGAITAALMRTVDWPVELVVGAVAYVIGWKWDLLSTRLWPWLLERVGLAKGEGTP